MVHFSEYSGRVEEIYLPEDGPTELGARTSIADAEWAEQEGGLPAGASALDGWIAGRERGGGICGGVEEDRAGPGGRPIWDTTRRRTTRSVRPLRTLSTWQRIGPSGANSAEFGFSRMHRPRLNG